VIAITINLPSEFLGHFRSVDELRQTIYEDFIIQQRQSGYLSLGEAAELLGLTYSELFTLLGKKGLSFINATAEELADSNRYFQAQMQPKNR